MGTAYPNTSALFDVVRDQKGRDLVLHQLSTRSTNLRTGQGARKLRIGAGLFNWRIGRFGPGAYIVLND